MQLLVLGQVTVICIVREGQRLLKHCGVNKMKIYFVLDLVEWVASEGINEPACRAVGSNLDRRNFFAVLNPDCCHCAKILFIYLFDILY